MIGIDEVGRGAWAGPLVVAGCYFTDTPDFVLQLNDSKKLTKQKREILEPKIKSCSVYKIVTINADKVDELGLSACLKIACTKIAQSMPVDATIILDGSYNFLKNTTYEDRVKTEIKADQKYSSVMAASILAKTYRDRLMSTYASQYPGFQFETNVGYGTVFHSQVLQKLGPTPIHRLSFKPMNAL